MAWKNSIGRDISHHNPIHNYNAARGSTDWWQIKVTESNTFIDSGAVQHYLGLAGDDRGAYHFARPGNFSTQINWFLNRKNFIGRMGNGWERPDMLDCEFPGVDASFIKGLVAEYRRQSGIRRVLVYVGYSDLRGACNPSGWYDADTPIWAARYRKLGPPTGPDAWKTHLGWDHPGLAIYQWDNASACPGGDRTDINAQRLDVKVVDDDMNLSDKIINPHTQQELGTLNDVTYETNAALWALIAKVDAGFGELTDDEAKIIAMIRAQPTGGQVDVDELAGKLLVTLGDSIAQSLGRKLIGDTA